MDKWVIEEHERTENPRKIKRKIRSKTEQHYEEARERDKKTLSR